MVNTYLTLKREVEASKIHIISARYDDNYPENVPENHREKFRCVQQLGGQQFSEYCSQPSMNPTTGPWQRERKKTAQSIFNKALKCREERLNEDGWRASIEYCLFNRFDTEVTCRACSKRLWRSEIEENPGKNNGLLNLSQRQENREPCECNPLNRQIDCSDLGIFELFSTRISELVTYEKTGPGSGKIELKPDRIIGLRETSTIKQLLKKPYVYREADWSHDSVVGERVNCSIHPDKGGNQLLFPFLVLEAKAGQASQGFDHAEVQSALPIMKALKLQHDLMKIPGNTVEVQGGPLVWFFANHGEDWRVYAAYIVEKDGETTYWIRCLWGGSMTSRNHALQLLLIIDSIIDWARDGYRLNILYQLKMLSARNTMDPADFTIDEDVYSVQNFRKVNSWNYARTLGPGGEDDAIEVEHWNQCQEDEVEEDQTMYLDRFGTAHGVVRDATRIDSHLLGFMLTKESFHILETSFDSVAAAREFSKEILEVLGERYLVLPGRGTLDKVEACWTGHTESLPIEVGDELKMEEKVYAQLRVSYFVDHEWRQVRQLNYLAVSEGALADIQICAGVRLLPGRLGKESASPSEINEEALLTSVKATLEDRTVRQDLKAALIRQVFYFEEVETTTKILDESGYYRFGLSSAVQKKLELKDGQAGVKMQRLIHTIHERFRIGQLSLPQPFLMSSLRIDLNTRLLWPGYTKGDSLPDSLYHMSRVLAYAKPPKVRPHQFPLDQELCIYVMDGTVAKQSCSSIATYLADASGDSIIHPTARRDKVETSPSSGADNRERHASKLRDLVSQFGINPDPILRSIMHWSDELKKRIKSHHEL